MQSSQHKVVMDVLRRLDGVHLLERLVLVGSWCLYFYQDYFDEPVLYSMLRTRDMDFLVPTPATNLPEVDVPALLSELGFVRSMKADGTIQLMHPEVMLEFLVAERGRGGHSPRPLPRLSLNAQSLRFMDIADDYSVWIEKDDLRVRLPHPAAFSLHKLLIVPRRKDRAKAARDVQSAVSMLNLLLQRNDTMILTELLTHFPKTWVKTIFRVLEEAGQKEILDRLQVMRP